MDMKGTTRDTEQKKVDKELAKVRSKFKAGKMSGYDRKKYICKLLYIYMLGYEIDFGHIEAVNLLSSDKYSEKHMGYLACTLLLHENHELVTLITNSMKRDLNNKHNYDHQCLALTAIANIGGKEQAESLSNDVQKVLVGSDTRLIVRKKAALTLLNMYRKYPELLPAEQWSGRLISLLASHKDLGVVTSLLSLLLGFVSVDPSAYLEAVPKVIRILTKLNNIREVPPNYLYYGVACPWLQVKCLRLLQYYEIPDKQLLSAISGIIHRAIQVADKVKGGERGKNVSKMNAAHCVLFEALNLLIHYDYDENELSHAATLLGRYLQDKDPNLRYLALDTMSRLAYTIHSDVKNSIRKHQMTVLLALKDPDISIRRRALDLLFSICNNQNASQIVGELSDYLPLSNYEMREELVLKIAILAERFATDFSWYVDVILSLISQAGDFVPDEILFRVIQIITNRGEELQKDSAQRIFRAISMPSAHENSVKIAGYILGEFGHLITGKDEFSPTKQFDLLYSKFETASTITKTLLLNTFIKFHNKYSNAELQSKIKKVFDLYRSFIDAELQQRANEYYNMSSLGNSSILKTVLATLPAFPERESSMMKKILDRRSQKNSRAVMVSKKEEVEEEDGDDGTDENAQIPEPSGSNVSTGQSDLLEIGGQDATATAVEQNSGSNTSGGGGLLDLDDLLGGPSETVPPQQTMNQNVSQPVDDIFAAPNPSLAQSAAAVAARNNQQRLVTGTSIESMIGMPKPMDAVENKAVQKDAEKKFTHLIVNSEGTAIEDDNLQVVVKSEFHSSKGRLLLQYGNKAKEAIAKVRCDVTPIPELQIQSSQVAPMIAPQTQIEQYLSVDCMAPFSDNARLTLYFEYNRKTYKFHIKLPILVHKFIEPTQLADGQAFFQQWNAVQKGSPQEVKNVVKPNGTVDIGKAKSLMSSGFRLAVLSGIDTNPNNAVASGTFHSQQSPYFVLVRLEMNTEYNAYRLTVRSGDATVSSELFKNLQQQLIDL